MPLMHAREETVRAYIEALHGTLDEVSSHFFSPDQAKRLLHRSLLPAKITCYVSTQFGVAFEYTTADSTTIETARGSARVEDLVVRAPLPLRTIGPMFNVTGANVGIENLTLADGFPFRLAHEQASVTLRRVQFSCDRLGWARDVQYAEIYGDRRSSRWSVEAAASRAKDEVLAAILLAQRAKKKDLGLHEYVSRFREKAVLVLGAYDQIGLERLSKISAALTDLGYEPLLIKDVPDFEHYDLSQKVAVVGALSRFIVVDDSSPSGHLTETEICRANRWVTVILRAHGQGASWMTAGASLTSNVILEKPYNPAAPTSALTEAVQWAEERLNQIGQKLSSLYPWRMES